MNTNTYDLKIAVGQLGGRMYYGVPAILYRHNLLSKLYTDWVANKFPVNIFYNAFPAIRARLNSHVPPFPPEWVSQMLATSLIKHFEKKLFHYTPSQLHTQYYYSLGTALEKSIIKDNFNRAQAIFMIGSTSALVFQEAKKRGLKTIKEQIIAPSQYTLALLQEVWEKYSDWENLDEERKVLTFWTDQQWKEWDSADYIVCGSSFVVDAMRKVGGPADKTVVIPYGVPFSGNQGQSPHNYPGGRKLRVLTVGTLGLRKGTPYIIESARQLQGECEFVLIGSIPQPLPRLLRDLPGNVKLVGHIPRSYIGSYYQWADVFLLPSLSEGSATVCYEALSYGLPLVVTPNTGQFITDGEEGFIIQPKSAEKITIALSKFLNQPQLVNEMSAKALKLSPQATLEAYEQRLMNFIHTIKPN